MYKMAISVFLKFSFLIPKIPKKLFFGGKISPKPNFFDIFKKPEYMLETYMW